LLAEIAADKRMHLVAGLAERAGDRVFNSAVLVGPRGHVGTYRKVHLFSEETRWFAPGTEGFTVWDLPAPTAVGGGSARVGMMICFDWIVPEAARTLALRGADLIAHPANLVLPYCPDAMVTRCLENRVWAVTANRIGAEERGGKAPLRFIGRSEVVSPSGEILYRASTDQVELRVVEIDPAQARDKHLNLFNDLFAQRRPELYG
jgi:predicted amidohydrolase